MESKKDELRAGLTQLTDLEIGRLKSVVVASYRNEPDVVVIALDDHCERVRAAAISAMVRMGMADNPIVAKALGDSAIEVRLAGARAAKSLLDFPLIPYLKSEQDPLVLEAIIFAVGERGETEAFDELCSIALKHPDALCREAAIAAFANFQNEASMSVLQVAALDKAPIRRRVAIALAGLEDTQASELLKKLSKDRDWQTRQIADELLAIELGSDRD